MKFPIDDFYGLQSPGGRRAANNLRCGLAKKRLALLVCVLLSSVFTSASFGFAQAPPLPQDAGTAEASESDAGALPSAEVPAEPASAAEATPLSPAEFDRLLQRLGSEKFAQREAALVELKRIAPAMPSQLRAAAQEHGDAEVRARVAFVYENVIRDDITLRGEAFLAGDTQGNTFPGWLRVAAIMGDKPEVRQVFLEATRRHPELMKTLDEKNLRARIDELEHVVHRIRKLMTELRQMPTPADALAVLWVLADGRIPVSMETQNLLVSLMQKAPASQLRRDRQLRDPFMDLVENWILRSRLEGASDTLWIATQWELRDAALTLGLRAVYEGQQPDVVQAGLKAIAQFGSPEMAIELTAFLDDQRIATEMIPDPPQTVVQVRDVAMAAIAMLLKQDLKKFGFSYARVHPRMGFDVTTVGFRDDQPAAREEVRSRILKLLQQYAEDPDAINPDAIKSTGEKPPAKKPASKNGSEG